MRWWWRKCYINCQCMYAYLCARGACICPLPLTNYQYNGCKHVERQTWYYYTNHYHDNNAMCVFCSISLSPSSYTISITVKNHDEIPPAYFFYDIKVVISPWKFFFAQNILFLIIVIKDNTIQCEKQERYYTDTTYLSNIFKSIASRNIMCNVIFNTSLKSHQKWVGKHVISWRCH